LGKFKRGSVVRVLSPDKNKKNTRERTQQNHTKKSVAGFTLRSFGVPVRVKILPESALRLA